MKLILVLLFHTSNIFHHSVNSIEIGNLDLYSCLRTALGEFKITSLTHRAVIEQLHAPDDYSANKDPIGPPGLPNEFLNHNGSRSQEVNLKNNRHDLEFLMMPKSVLKEKIRYLLFTKQNVHEYQVMAEDGSVEGVNWNPRALTKVLIHGLTSTYWLSPIRNIWSQHIFDIKDAYLNDASDTDFNIVVVDWTSLSTVPLSKYPDAAKATRLAGEDVANFLAALLNSGNIFTWKSLHLLGHSLGAHVAGIAGSKLQAMGEQYVIERITGMDPAGLCFDSVSSENPYNTSDVLDKTDAKFVDVIHTNMGNIVTSGAGRYGSIMEAGHADFYPNGGAVQLGCSFIEDRLEYCSHRKSVAFYALSIAKQRVACPCTNWDLYRASSCMCDVNTGGYFFGELCDPSARGKFFLGGF